MPKRHPKPPNRTPPTESVHLLEKQLVYPTDTTLRRRRRTKEDCRIDNEMKVYKIFKKRRMCVSPPPPGTRSNTEGKARGPTFETLGGGDKFAKLGRHVQNKSKCLKLQDCKLRPMANFRGPSLHEMMDGGHPGEVVRLFPTGCNGSADLDGGAAVAGAVQLPVKLHEGPLAHPRLHQRLVVRVIPPAAR